MLTGPLFLLRRRFGSRIETVLLGSDPVARREHLRVAVVFAVSVAAVTVIVRHSGLVISPVVWEFVLVLASLALLGLPAANAYWRGGLLVGYTLVFAPVATGLSVAVLEIGAFDDVFSAVAFGGVAIGLLAIIVGTFGHLLGRASRWFVTRRGTNL